MHSSGHAGLQPSSNTNNNESNAFAPTTKSEKTLTQNAKQQFPFNQLPDSVLVQTLSLLPTKHKLSVISKVDNRFRSVLNTPTSWDKTETFGFSFQGCYTLEESELSASTLVFHVPYEPDSRSQSDWWNYYDHRSLSLCGTNLKCIRLSGYENDLPKALQQFIVDKVKQMMHDGQLQYLDMQFSSYDFHRPDLTNTSSFHSFYKALAQTVLADTHKICKVGLLTLHLHHLIVPEKEADDEEYCRMIMAMPVVQRLQIHSHSLIGGIGDDDDTIAERVRRCGPLRTLSGKHVTELRLNDFEPAILSALCPFLNQLMPDCLQSVTLNFFLEPLVDVADSFFDCMNSEQLSEVTVFAVNEVRLQTADDFTLGIFNNVLSRIVDCVPNLIECRLTNWRICVNVNEPVALYSELIELFWSFARVGSITIKVNLSYTADDPDVAACLQHFCANHSLELEDHTGPMRTELSTRCSVDYDSKAWRLVQNHRTYQLYMKVWYKGAHLDFSIDVSCCQMHKRYELNKAAIKPVPDDDGHGMTGSAAEACGTS